jgi:hypothetical protein
MAKTKPKDLLLQKGEKIVLGIALAVMALFVVLGVSSFLAAESPTAKATEFKNKAENIKRDISRENGESGITPLTVPDLAMRPIDARFFRSPYIPFETVDVPSNKRDNPVVLGIIDAQVDLVRAPIKAFDVITYEDGRREIGLLYNVRVGTLDNARLLEMGARMRNQLNRPNPGALTPPPPPPPPAANPQPPAPALNVSPQGFGRGREGLGGGGGDLGQTAAAGQRSEKTVRYVPSDQMEKELSNPMNGTTPPIPAVAVYPVRMVVVHAAFPLKEQLEVIRRALRLKTIADASTATTTPPSTTGPTFTGFEVERKITAPNGQVYDWAPYDHTAQYIDKIGVRKFGDQPDDGLLAYFLRYEQFMAMPLPALAASLSEYPGVRLESIVRTYRKLQDAAKPPIKPSDLQKKIEGKEGGNPFIPTGGVQNVGGIYNGFAGGGDAPTQGVAPGRGFVEGKGPRGSPPNAPTNPEASPLAVPANLPELEHMLIRFLDVDIRPGFTYQYRIRVKMKNPNFGSKDVNRNEDATIDTLFGPWVTIANSVGVPADRNLYAGDPIAYNDRVKREFKDPAVVRLLDNKGGELPVVQFQNWTEKIAVDTGKTEPAGYWVVSEVPVSRGEYVGRRQIVPLPMWSSEKANFILQELPKYSVWQAREKPRGLMVDFTSKTMLVDYEGGRVRQRFGERSVEDDADTEIMLLEPNGRVVVRNSGVDRDNADRQRREAQWRKWLEEIKAITERAGLLTQPAESGGAAPGQNPR